jgi:hypothetical protein
MIGAAHLGAVRWNRFMRTVSEYETKRRNFIERGTLLFSFLCDEFSYSGPVHSFYQQPNGVVIADYLQYDNEEIDRRIVLKNAYHPVDYGFELQFFRPSVSTRHADRFMAHYVLKEEQDVEQSYLLGAAALAKDKYRKVIDGEEWPHSI